MHYTFRSGTVYVPFNLHYKPDPQSAHWSVKEISLSTQDEIKKKVDAPPTLRMS